MQASTIRTMEEVSDYAEYSIDTGSASIPVTFAGAMLDSFKNVFTDKMEAIEQAEGKKIDVLIAEYLDVN